MVPWRLTLTICPFDGRWGHRRPNEAGPAGHNLKPGGAGGFMTEEAA
jgi:hypothetical protein